MLTKEQARGAILGYVVLYKKKYGGSKENQTALGKETTSYVVTSLEEYTSYQFSMQAFNNKGVSNESASVETTTDEDSKLLYIQHIIVQQYRYLRKISGPLLELANTIMVILLSLFTFSLVIIIYIFNYFPPYTSKQLQKMHRFIPPTSLLVMLEIKAANV